MGNMKKALYVIVNKCSWDGFLPAHLLPMIYRVDGKKTKSLAGPDSREPV